MMAVIRASACVCCVYLSGARNVIYAGTAQSLFTAYLYCSNKLTTSAGRFDSRGAAAACSRAREYLVGNTLTAVR